VTMTASARLLLLCSLLLLASGVAHAHGVQGKDAAFVAANQGQQLIPFLYLGAKHMVTGYDHLLFILGVIFFLFRLTHVAIYVTLFSIGHSITLLTGVLNHIDVNPYLVDAVIGLSVASKPSSAFSPAPAAPSSPSVSSTASVWRRSFRI
jgi:hypothetical protein